MDMTGAERASNSLALAAAPYAELSANSTNVLMIGSKPTTHPVTSAATIAAGVGIIRLDVEMTSVGVQAATTPVIVAATVYTFIIHSLVYLSAKSCPHRQDRVSFSIVPEPTALTTEQRKSTPILRDGK